MLAWAAFARIPMSFMVVSGFTTFYTQNPDWGQILAYASMITLPVLVVFMIFQRWFIQSVMASGVKG